MYRGDTGPRKLRQQSAIQFALEDEDDEHGEELLKMEERRNGGKYDVVEIFSPPRLCRRASEKRMKGGWSLDWSVQDPITGKIRLKTNKRY